MSEKINILYVSHSSFYNGAEVCLHTLIKKLDRSLFNPVVVFPYEGPLEEEMKRMNVKTYISPLDRWIRYEHDKPVRNIDLRERTRGIMRIIENEFIRIVHTNTSVILEGAVAAKMKNIPHVWHIHEFLKGHSELSACLPLPFVYEIISGLSEKVVSVSEFVQSQFSNITDDRFVTIYNGIEENNGLEHSGLTRRELGFSEDDIVAVSIGLLTEAKGYDNLLKTVSIIKTRGQKLKVLWIGGSYKKYRNDFESKLKTLGLKDSVFYMGFRDDIPDILKLCDLFICPSLMETFSLAAVESMAAGKAVVTTDCGGITECVVDGETGYVAPKNDPEILSQKVLDLIMNADKRKLFGANGLQRYKEKFTSNIYAGNIQQMYNQILSDKKDRSLSDRESSFMDSAYDVYQVISDSHWRHMNGSSKKRFFS